MLQPIVGISLLLRAHVKSPNGVRLAEHLVPLDAHGPTPIHSPKKMCPRAVQHSVALMTRVRRLALQAGLLATMDEVSLAFQLRSTVLRSTIFRSNNGMISIRRRMRSRAISRVLELERP